MLRVGTPNLDAPRSPGKTQQEDLDIAACYTSNVWAGIFGTLRG